MSRIGKKPVAIPSGVAAKVARKILLDRPADHHSHDGVLRRRPALERADVATVAQHAHAIAQAEATSSAFTL